MRRGIYLLGLLIYANNALSQNADNIIIKDTRNDNNPPSAYGRNVKFEFKYRSVVNMPGENLYSGIMTIAPWSDNSGNKHHQLGFNDGGIFYRQGLPAGTWEEWRKVLVEDVNGGTNVNKSIVLGIPNDPMNIYVPSGTSTGGYNIDFNTWRDMTPDQIGARIRAERINNFGDNNALVQGVDLVFSTGDGWPNSLAERLRIKLNGNVGIGTATPTEKLTVKGNVCATNLISESEGGLILGNPNHGIRRIGNIVDIYTSGSFESALTFTHRDYNTTTGTYSTLKEALRIDNLGNVGIGTSTPTEKLAVNGNIRTKKIIVTQSEWPDYVFDSAYNLPSLESISSYIKENKHLPEMPSATAIEKDGHDLGEVQRLLLKKVEELTLYVIELERKIKASESKVY